MKMVKKCKNGLNQINLFIYVFALFYLVFGCLFVVYDKFIGNIHF